MAAKHILALAISLMVASVAHGEANRLSNPSAQDGSSDIQANLPEGMKYRLIGPFRGGRSPAVAGSTKDPNTYYFGAASGGIWKTTDSGITWNPLWDKFSEASPAVGAITVSPSNPDIIYVGTGESCIRGNVVTGNGIYKSTDAGKTWSFSGLRDNEAVGRIAVDPKDPNNVFVAALGHIFADSTERGIFHSQDGGKTWKRVLYVDNKTGGVDVQFDPSNSKVLYASMWQAYRKPWIMESGGPGSGLYRSTDGGETWQKLSGHGLPDGLLGRIGVAPTPDSKRVYALIEAKEGGLYRTDDGGENWKLINGDNNYKQRAWYYMHVFADPKDANVVYIMNTGAYRSADGGKTFKAMRTFHGDNHQLWIDPNNPNRMINSNDGGADISVNGGETWTSEMNQPTAQFYHISADNRFPYYVYGAQQDNTTVATATASASGSISTSDWYPVGGGESGYIVSDPTNPMIVYAGSYGGLITRYDHSNNQTQEINPWPRNTMGWGPGDLKHRFQWTAPIVLSPHDPHAVYFGGEVLFRTTDGGHSWRILSPDLTRNDKSKQLSSGGPLTKDNTTVETFGTIFSIAESPAQKGQIWVGTDDGLIQLTQDDGAHWQNVTPKEMPEWCTVDMVEADPSDAASAYIAADCHRLDDLKPYAFKTHDFGKTWTPIVDGIPGDAYVHVVRVDPKRKGLLYAGTERGIFVSFDDGTHWKSLQLNLPVVPVHDLLIHNNDLAVATHGRSFWILDDLGPLQQWNDQVAQQDSYLFAPAPSNRTIFSGRGAGGAAGQNPPSGALFYYYLKTAVKVPEPESKGKNAAKREPSDAADPKRVKLEILDPDGKVIRTFPDPHAQAPNSGGGEEEEFRGRRQAPLTGSAGINHFVWDQRYEAATRIPKSPLWAGSVDGPKALPGKYQVRLTVDGKSQTQPFEIEPDPRVKSTQEDLKKQFDLHMAINTELTRVHDSILSIRKLRTQIDDVDKKAAQDKKLADAGAALDAKITAVEEALIQRKAVASEDPLNFPIHLNNMLAALGSTVASADTAPTEQDYETFNELKAESEAELAKWEAIKKNDLPSYNKLVQRDKLPEVSVPAI